MQARRRRLEPRAILNSASGAVRHLRFQTDPNVMTYNRLNARALCTPAELELVLLSFPDQVKTLSEARLKLKRTRARALRDKYRDLLRRQKLATRERSGSKLGRGPQTNARTADKAKLFDETLKRFEAQLAVKEAAARKAEKVAAARSKLASIQKATKSLVAKRAAGPGSRVSAKAASAASKRAPSAKPSKAAGFVSERALQASRDQRLMSKGSLKVQTHASARGRRNQAKRDARPR